MNKLKTGMLGMLVLVAVISLFGIVITDVSATHTSMCQPGGSCHSAGYCGSPGTECCYTYSYYYDHAWHYSTTCKCC